MENERKGMYGELTELAEKMLLNLESLKRMEDMEKEFKEERANKNILEDELAQLK